MTDGDEGAITIVGNLGSLVLTDTTVPPDACVAEVTGVANGDSTLTVTVGGTAVARTNGVIGSAAASTACGTTGGTLVFTTSS